MRHILVPAALVAAMLTCSFCALRRPPPARSRPDRARPDPGQPAAGALLFGGRLDLNHATAADLAALPAVGANRAAAIVRARVERGGRFDDVDDLLEVPGVGAGTLARIRPLVTVSP